MSASQRHVFHYSLATVHMLLFMTKPFSCRLSAFGVHTGHFSPSKDDDIIVLFHIEVMTCFGHSKEYLFKTQGNILYNRIK